MSFCPFCGEPLDAQLDTCPHCNANLKETEPEAPEPTEAPELTEEPESPEAPETGETSESADLPEAPETGEAPEAPESSETPGAPAKASPRRKRMIIAAVVAAVVIVAAVGGYALYDYHRGTVYAESISQFEQGDYAAALEGFRSLGDYEDSQARARYCEQGVAYQDAEALLAAKDYSAAREAFAALGDFKDADSRVEACDAWLAYEQARDLASRGQYEEALQKAEQFSSVSEVRNDADVLKWRSETAYSYAEELLAAGLYYSAYKTYDDLGEYGDAEARRDACVQSMPSSSELYHNPSYVSSSTDIIFDASSSRRATYLKMYSGSDLVSTVFVNPGSQATIQIPAGTYSIKKSQGNEWFGEQEMFGDDGVYQLLLFDGGNEIVNIDGNSIYTVSLDIQGGGNVGDRNVDPGSF